MYRHPVLRRLLLSMGLVIVGVVLLGTLGATKVPAGAYQLSHSRLAQQLSAD